MYLSIKHEYEENDKEIEVEPSNVPWLFLYTRQNILTIYISVAGILVTKDSRDAGKKSQYLYRYFQERFPEENYDFRGEFINAYRHPMNIDSIADWFNRKAPNANHKLNIIQFAISVASVDGQIIDREYELIKAFHLRMKLPLAELDRLMNIYQQQQESQQEQINTDSSESYRISKKERCCKILGISIDASQQEIKSAYRNLAKKHHPDHFMNESKMQQKLANERFIEILKAYEYLVS